MDESTIKRCKIEDCGRTGKLTRGWCSKHYGRWRTHGDPTKTLNPNLASGTPEERFWVKVDAEGDCWEWTACKNEDGYGIFGTKRGNKLAHRFSWELLIGPIAEDKELDHRCRNRACVNPLHCVETTHADNNRRGYSPTAVNARKTHCPKNHEYTPENTSYWNGYRSCKECDRIAARARYRKNKGRKDK